MAVVLPSCLRYTCPIASYVQCLHVQIVYGRFRYPLASDDHDHSLWITVRYGYRFRSRYPFTLDITSLWIPLHFECPSL